LKFSKNAQAALAEPDTRMKAIELTPELKEKYKRAAHDMNDWLRARTSGPMEAYMILQFVVQAFEECYGIRGGIIVGDDDFKNGVKQ
jgi:hypothetical protein